MNSEVVKIVYKDKLIAIIIPYNYENDGIEFFTPDELSQQVAYMSHRKGHTIAPHIHNAVHRDVHYTKETLVIRMGSVRVDFYDDDRTYIESRILSAGDIILLAGGGHGFKGLEDYSMVEIKQGPYTGEGDKTRFVGVEDNEIIVK